MERRIAVRGIAYLEGKILAQQFKLKDGGETDYWGTPGGGLDPAESLADGLYREMIEETGIAPKIGKLLFTQQFLFTHHNGDVREHLEFFLHIENPEDYTVIDLAKTTHGLHELTRCEYIDPVKETILPKFLQTLPITDYISGNEPVYLADYLSEQR